MHKHIVVLNQALPSTGTIFSFSTGCVLAVLTVTGGHPIVAGSGVAYHLLSKISR